MASEHECSEGKIETNIGTAKEPVSFLDNTKFFHNFTPSMEACKSARLFNPGKVTDLKPTAASLDTLKAFPFFKDELIEALKQELPSYLAAADGTPREVNPLEWWEHN